MFLAFSFGAFLDSASAEHSRGKQSGAETHTKTHITVLCSWLEAHLQEFQKRRFGHARLFNESHGIGEVVHVIAVNIQHHGLGKLWKQKWLSDFVTTAAQ